MSRLNRHWPSHRSSWCSCCVWRALPPWPPRSGVSTRPERQRGWLRAAMTVAPGPWSPTSGPPVPSCGYDRMVAASPPASVRHRPCYRGSSSPPKLSPRSNPQRAERGSATLAAALLIAVLVSVSMGGVALGSAVIARHRAQSVADLAALAAAGRVGLGQDAACASAIVIADRMQASVTGCAIDGLDVVVHTEVSAGLGRWGLGWARAAARAGPVTAGQGSPSRLRPS